MFGVEMAPRRQVTPETGPAHRRFRWLPLVIGPIVLVIIVMTLEPLRLIALLRRADVSLLVLACAINLPPILMRTLRWRLLLRSADIDLPRYRDLTAIYAYSVFVGVATPGRVGEFVKTVHLTRRGMSFGAAAASVLIDRLLDIFFMAFVAVAALFSLSLKGLESAPKVAGVVVVFAIGALAVWKATRSTGPERCLEILAQKLPERLSRICARLASISRDFRETVQGLSVSQLAGAIALTACAWATSYFANYLLACSLSLNIGYFDIVGISAITSLAAQLPITILGAGTRDAAMIVVLARYGATSEQAVALSMLFLAIMVCTALFCSASMVTHAVRFHRQDDTPAPLA